MNLDLPLRDATTTLLLTVDHPDSPAAESLVVHVYDELRQLARRQLARERRTATIQTTELVHEAYLRLIDGTRITERGRAYFFGAAARAMRQVLVDAARRRGAAKRGGGVAPLTLEESQFAVDEYAGELLDLDRALTALEERNPRHARVVECRFFAGLSVEETAAALGISPRTVKSDWAFARAWLFAALHGPAPETQP
jgi:RNA polymerase sigma factor (TIGR02999 family)